MRQVQHEGASEMRGSGPVGCRPPRRFHQHGSRLYGFPPEAICRNIFDRSGRSVQRAGADLVDCGGPSEVVGEHFRGNPGSVVRTLCMLSDREGFVARRTTDSAHVRAGHTHGH